MHTDPIADLLTRIRNANSANHETTICPHSKMKEDVLNVMKGFGFIEDYETETNEKNFKSLIIKLKENQPELTLTRISKPGQRIYVKREDLKRPVKSGLGIKILSTSKGVMSNVEAKKENVGGELICEIY
jgi:small subunit ribosomal protein S8